MMTQQQLKQRTKKFAHASVRPAVELPPSDPGRHIRGQLIRSATSVAANYRAACLSQSRATFTAKISIFLEEADECQFWLEFIQEGKLLSHGRVQPLLSEAGELTALFYSTRRSLKERH